MARTGKLAAFAVAGMAVIGGLGAAGALPDVSELSGGHGAVETVPPEPAAETGVEHATAGSTLAVPGDLGSHGGSAAADDVESAASQGDGLATAAGNVTNDTASAVIETLIATEPGPGLGTAVSEVASGGQANAPTDVPPALPDQASNGQSHRP